MQGIDVILRRVFKVCWIIGIVSFGLMYFDFAKQPAFFFAWGAFIVGFTAGMILNTRVLINKFRKD